jgi:hypothetical protein
VLASSSAQRRDYLLRSARAGAVGTVGGGAIPAGTRLTGEKQALVDRRGEQLPGVSVARLGMGVGAQRMRIARPAKVNEARRIAVNIGKLLALLGLIKGPPMRRLAQDSGTLTACYAPQTGAN